MIRTKLRVACLAAAILVGSGGPFAAAEPEAPPLPPAPIDWHDFIDSDMNGDHVVGEELCVAPNTGESTPVSFVIL